MGTRMLVGGGVAAVAVLALVITLLGNQPSTQAATWPVAKVALAAVRQGEAPRQAFAAGELEAANQVQVAAETAGRVTRIAFESGQAVKAGQLLVQLNDAPEQADRLRLHAQLRNAQTLFLRIQKLAAVNVATQEQLDNATAALDMAKGELQQVDARIAQKAIRAPFAGQVGIRRVHQGQYLQTGETIASLVDTQRLHVNFALSEQASPGLRVGQIAQLTVDALPREHFSAQINAIDPLIGQSRSVRVQATLANPGGQLQAGMYASVRLSAVQSPTVLVVPETAITYTAYGQTVFIASADPAGALSVRRVQVTTGERWQGLVEITSGLALDDQVVVSGQLKLSDGMPVEAVEQNTLDVEGNRAS
ncbi:MULTISPECIES: efflux RND transporter periplasmic adaptor subunit [unclassified Pseudomonas]|uniref:efflux RND transporter periplasmic adaptor subunit n=1 Tax=unclassified Pseudomonas TaxID=196821 RepID=UPI001474B49F|nr:MULTISPECIES: efflux RND transporter periplasmic adaptor subunit [unclassified Pseudomonas]NMX90527.1 efflux RND transporter periplasmic adaptor subunit [Pseudomonas sp. WS 5086]NMY45811.1 efflux RND transporter periplasmic adaptor subunit [Pseudomonas sp. WS 5027]